MRIVTRLNNNPWGLTSLESISRFEHNDIFHVFDVFSDSYLDEVFKEKGQPRYIVSDCYTRFNSKYNVFCCPFSSSAEIDSRAKKLTLSKQQLITNTANFCIDKKRIPRFLCIKLVEIFGINTCYLWSGDGAVEDLSKILYELKSCPGLLTEDQKSILLSPISIDPSPFPDTSDKVQYFYNGVLDVYNNTAVSLITESIDYEQAAIFTEKTFRSILGLNFPIWIGGHHQANEWKKLGFDIFSDVIDHSYQYYPTLIERSYYAFRLNQHILLNLDQAQDLRIRYWDRLLNNREKLVNQELGRACQNIIQTWPQDLREAVNQLVNLPIIF